MTSVTNHLEFGAFLKRLRTSRKARVAPTARAAGLHRSTLHRWERGEALPRLWELDALLTTLQATGQQKKQALALMDAPRAEQQVRQQIRQIAENLEIQSLPHGGDLLQAMRLRRRWTLEEAASQIGISDRTLRRWEQGAIWPSIEQLHALCFALKAEEEEVVALTCGHLRFDAANERLSPTPSLEQLNQRLGEMAWRLFLPGEQRMLDLELLMLERQAWRLATRQESGRTLLARAYGIHARHHLHRGDYREEERAATRALDILPEKEYHREFAMSAAVAVAHGATYGGKKSLPRKGIEVMRHWLPNKRWLNVACWAHSEMAEYVCMVGNIEAGLAINEQARQMAQDVSAEVQQQRDFSHAYLLFHYAGKPAEAFKILPVPEGVHSPSMHIETSLLRSEILAALQELEDARRSLDYTLRLMEACPMEQYRPRADAVAQRL